MNEKRGEQRRYGQSTDKFHGWSLLKRRKSPLVPESYITYLSRIHLKMSNIVTGFDWIWMGLARFN